MTHISDPEWFHRFSCPASPETSLVSLGEFFFLLQHYVFIAENQWYPTPVLLPGKSHEWRSLEAAVHGVAEGQTRLSYFPFTFHFHALEKKVATTPLFFPGESEGLGSLVGCHL